MPGPASPSPGSACAPSLAFSPSSLLPLFSLPFPPPFSPFPFLPSPARPLLFHLSFLPAPRGAPCLGLVGGHRRSGGGGPVDCPLPPPQPHRPAPEHLPLVDPILGPRGSPALRPTRIRECLQGAGWAWAWKAGLTAGWWGAHIPLIARTGRHPPPPRACPAPYISPTSFPLSLSSPLLLITQLSGGPQPQLLGS